MCVGHQSQVCWMLIQKQHNIFNLKQWGFKVGQSFWCCRKWHGMGPDWI